MAKTSRYRGVCWWEKRGQWRLSIRRAGIHLLCDSELEAAMLYNAAARVLWPGCRLNVTPAGESGDFVMAPYGRAFWLGPGLYAIVDQNRTPATPVVFKDLTEYQWFYRQGMACRAIYDEALGVFKLITMQEMVFGGPCFHRNGNLLDNRRVNLAAPLAEPVAILEAGPRDSAEAETEGSADPRSAR